MTTLIRDFNPLHIRDIHARLSPHQKRERRPHILVDVDDVLADFHGPYWKVIVRAIGKEYPELKAGWSDQEGKYWDALDGLYHQGKITQEAFKVGERAVKKAMASRGFCRRLFPREGAQHAISVLQQLGTVTVVTSPYNSPFWVAERYAWLKKWFPSIPMNRIIHARDKTMIDGDVLIDDKASTVVSWMNERSHMVFGIIKDTRGLHLPHPTTAKKGEFPPLQSYLRRHATWDGVIETCRRVSRFYRDGEDGQ